MATTIDIANLDNQETMLEYLRILFASTLETEELERVIADLKAEVAGDLESTVAAETTRATNAETKLSNKIDELTNGGVTTFNSRSGAVIPASGDYTAEQVEYTDSEDNPLGATTVQGAIDALKAGTGVTSFNNRSGAVSPESGDYTASQITYDGTTSGLTAFTTVQALLDALAEAYITDDEYTTLSALLD